MKLPADGRGEIERELFLEVLRAFGEAKLAVTGTSMLPSVWPGDILEVRRASATEILAGEIALFERGGRLFAHRVVSRVVEKVPRVNTAVGEPGVDGEDTGATGSRVLLVTRGDRLREADPPVEPEQVLGRVTGVLRGNSSVVPKAPRMPSLSGLTRWVRIASWALSRSDLATRLLVRLHGAWRVGRGRAAGRIENREARPERLYEAS
jgi:hypothetical protein